MSGYELSSFSTAITSTGPSQLNPLESHMIGSRKGKQASFKIFTMTKSLFILVRGPDRQFIVSQKQTKELRVTLAEDFSLPVPLSQELSSVLN